ncbi:MAG TPA: G5 domain-containing protein [Candidatus Saccharimonadales bacterium]|nr:G5 domain-containing protein [Candidatus Saccharimonadales bacterium]
MKSLLRISTTPFGLIIAIASLLVACFGVVIASRVSAEPTQPAAGQRLITIHDRGQNKGIITKATTLRDAFAEAGIEIDPNDIVEPGLDESLVANNYEVNVYRARPVTIIDGAIRQKIMSSYQTPKQITAQAHIDLHDEDIATIDANTDMVSQGAGVQLSIARATPFNLVLYGTKKTAYTQAKTVGDMLKQKAITIGKDDTLSVAKDASIQSGMTIELWRNGKQTATEEHDVAFETEKIQDADHEVGYKQIKTPGVVGKKTVTFEIEMKNGQEISRKEIQSVVTKEASKQVEVIGTKMSNTFSGDFGGALARLRSCESGGNYANTKNPKYRGAYQYDYSTWANYGGFYDPADAPASVQDQKAWETYQRRGWQPWPSCKASQGLQDIYR